MSDNRNNRTIRFILETKNQKLLFVGIAVLIAGLLAVLLAKKFNRTMYQERQQMLSMVMYSAARNFSERIQSEWDIYDLTYSIVSRSISGSENVKECVSEINIQHDFGSDYYFFVDEDGNYYSSDGVAGKLDDFTNYLKTSPDRMVYLSTLPHRNPRKTFMIYRGRFDEVMRLNTDSGQKVIVFFAYAQDITEVKNSIGGMFREASNIFIFDSVGSTLYEEYGHQTLIEGHNMFRKLSQCRMSFGESVEDLEHKVREGRDVVAEVKVKGEEYYFCSSPLDISDWNLSILVPPQDLNRNVADAILVLILYSLGILLVIGALLVFITYSARIKAQEERLEESRQMMAAIEETSRAKTVFLSNMSHDIRTPINGIMGISTIARNFLDKPEKVKECLDKIDDASGHLLSLINDVLDMSRIESGKTTITVDAADITEICRSCAEMAKGQIGARDIRFISEFDVKHPRVFADAIHLRRIFINILGNAVKFTRDGGRIIFRCRETGCTDQQINCRFEVKDTGIGMSKKFLGIIFEAFSQEENRERTKYGGTGLGMAITKQLVELMGGTIDVESEVNKGSSFYVNLSFKRNLQEIDASPEEEGVPLTGIENTRILLVEDNELNMEIAESLLMFSGAVVDKAWDGLEAIDKFTSKDIGSYDIILMDIMMPRMDGYEAAKTIRSLDREDAADIPIIAMTANAFEDDIRATREAGMNAHLSKPIEMEAVIRTIASFVHKS